MKINTIIPGFLSIILCYSVSVHAGCAGQAVAACNTITDKITCSSSYEQGQCDTLTKKTYCSQCSVCSPGHSDCVKGAPGCHPCHPHTNIHPCGTQCKWDTSCTNTGSSCSYKEGHSK